MITDCPATVCHANASIHEVCELIEQLRVERSCSDAIAREFLAQMVETARILRRFSLSALSIGAIQPVLDLAVRLNPDLRDTVLLPDEEETR